MPNAFTDSLDRLGAQLWLDADPACHPCTPALLNVGGGLAGARLAPHAYQDVFADSAKHALWKQLPRSALDCGVEPLFSRILLADAQTLAQALLPLHTASRHLKGWVIVDRPDWCELPAPAALGQFQQASSSTGCPNLLFSVPATPGHLPLIQAAFAQGLSLHTPLHGGARMLEALLDAYKQGASKAPPADAPPLLVASVSLGGITEAVTPLLPAFFPGRDQVPIAYGRMLYESLQALLGRLGLRGNGKPYQAPLLAWDFNGRASALPEEEVRVLNALVGSRIALLARPCVCEESARRGRAQLSVIEHTEEAEALLKELHRLGVDLDEMCIRSADMLQMEKTRLLDKTLQDLTQLRNGLNRLPHS